ncbi:MAG: hypothetical protein RL701_6602 [Pseudomonadota bacterium]|jgi:hypothetical protein
MVPLNGMLHAREALGQPAVPATRLWQARVGLALGQACPRQPAKAGSPAVRGSACTLALTGSRWRSHGWRRRRHTSQEDIPCTRHLPINS